MLQPRLCAFAVLATSFLAGVAQGETRFGRTVAKLSNPKDFEFVNLEDNRFPVLRRGATTVACIAYRESQRYFVEIAVTNQTAAPIELPKDFVKFRSASTTIALDTMSVAAEIEKAAAAAPGTQGISTSRSSTVADGHISTGDQPRGASAMLEAINHTAQLQSGQLATRLNTFAHEKQGPFLAPGKTQFYIFVFEQSEHKKSPFEIAVATAADSWIFPYKE